MTGPSQSISARTLSHLLPPTVELASPVYAALADGIVALLRDGRVAPGTRLPSERELAVTLGLSRATVTAAYDRLREGSLLLSRAGAGSVTAIPPALGRRPSASRWSTAEGAIDLTCAALAAPAGLLTRAVVDAAPRLAELETGDGYDPVGLPELRAGIAERFTARGVVTGPEQIMVTSGALHAFDLLLRLLTGPGDRVLTELPSYPGALDAIRANNARLVAVPIAYGGGWAVSQLTAALRQSAAKLAYLIPDYHNPTGALVPEHDRREVLRAARRLGTTVVVDESFVELGFGEAERPTAALDASVITIGSLSKPVWGGLRVGWVRGPAELVGRLAALRATTDMAGSALDQAVAVELLRHLEDIVAARIEQLLPRRDALLAAVARELPGWRVPPPAGGLSVWAELDAPLATPLSLLAARHGVTIVPGARFGVDGTLERFIRLPFAQPADVLSESVTRLAAAWHQLDRTEIAGHRLVVA